jgi:CheY-like chemotaxis protein
LFVQGPQSLARTEGGLGIGLTLLKSLVELHDGRVEAFSEGPERGSVFTVHLPLAISAARREFDGEPAARTPVNTVVIVEDQADARRMMQILLEGEGVTVFTAADGAEGLELIQRVHPDLALIDLGLPVMSGFEVARRLRRDAANRRTRLVALSGYGQDADIQEALAAGFDEHLTKPTDHARLESLLKGAPSRVRDRRKPTAPSSVS